MEIIKTGRTLLFYHNYFNSGLVKLLNPNQSYIINIRTYAARKGYREAAKKKKVKTVIQKRAWIPHNLRKKSLEEQAIQRRTNEDKKPTSPNDVWISRYYAWRIFDFKEAVECHRETHHPTVYNVPDAPVNLYFELDMRTEKPTRFVEKFKRMAMLPNIFEQDNVQERSILAFCKTSEQKEAALNAGATLVGGVEIIKEIEKGKIVLPDFRFVIAHPTILPEMVTIRGLLKRRFPNVTAGTLGPNIGEIVAKFKNGVEYSCLRDEKQLDYGWIETIVGRLNMDTEKLEENFKAFVEEINSHRPKRKGPFITRVLMSSPPSVEKLKINLDPYSEEDKGADEGESSDEDEAGAVQAAV